MTATTDDPSAKIKITLTNTDHAEGIEIANKAKATWASGENTITVVVTDNEGMADESVTTYVVIVTKA